MMRGAWFCLLVTWFTTLHGCSRRPDGTHGTAQRNPEEPRSVPLPSADAGRGRVPEPGSEPSAASVAPELRAGVYRLTLLADHGSRRGASTEGSLTLVSTSAADKSQSTGEVAKDVYDVPPFYGWVELDFQRVAAPTCRHPDPASRDPVRPGALVRADKYHRHQVVLIGTVSNLRDGSLYTDGCGNALNVEGSKGNCYLGSWDRWGIAVDGSGTFRACFVPNSASP